jgi:hypothetical protein
MRVIFVALSLGVLSSCVPALRRPEAEVMSANRIVSVIQSNQEKRQRLSAHYKVRATGIKRIFGTVDFTIVLQQPSSLYLSVPSFFGMPARVITSDGEHNYILDVTDKEPTYLVESSAADTLDRWMGFPVQPREFVFGLLGILDLKNAAIVDISLNHRKNSYTIKLRYEDRRECYAELDADTDELLSQTIYKDGNKIYALEYSDFRKTKLGRFPWQTQALLNSSNGSAKLVLTVDDDIRFDDEPFEVDTFQIEAP